MPYTNKKKVSEADFSSAVDALSEVRVAIMQLRGTSALYGAQAYHERHDALLAEEVRLLKLVENITFALFHARHN